MKSRSKSLANLTTALLAACLWMGLTSSAAAAAPDVLEAGRRLYEAGVTTSTQPLIGFTTGGAELAGARAACARCHRRSGSGAFEGGSRIPAVTGAALFSAPEATTRHQPRLPSGSTVQPFRELERPPYDSAALQRALREGIDAGGKPLHSLMPRYALAPDDLAALEAYLRQLSVAASPGVIGRTVHLSMALAPDASPAARQVASQVVAACLAERFPETAPNGLHAKLQVWNLHGTPAEWTRQLQEAQAAQPAYAMVSGVGASHWAPVQQFCEAERLPCLFPSVDVPGTRKPSRQTFYFSAGTVLEGEVMAQWIAALPANGSPPSRVVAIRLASDEAAAAGLNAMTKALGSALPVEERRIATADNAALQRAMANLGRGDVLALWLPARELQALSGLAPQLPSVHAVIASGWLAGEALQAAPADWRRVLHFTWALDPPLRLERRMHVNLRPWLADKGIQVGRSEERVAGDALTACNVFVESVARQRGPLTRDKLVEQVENYPAAMGNAMAPEAYHQFSLGPGQRFTSKGAFVVRFAGADWRRLEPVGDWRVP